MPIGHSSAPFAVENDPAGASARQTCLEALAWKLSGHISQEATALAVGPLIEFSSQGWHSVFAAFPSSPAGHSTEKIRQVNDWTNDILV